MRGPFLIAGLLNAAALSAFFISNIGWKCEKGYLEAAHRYVSDAPLEVIQRAITNDNDDDEVDTATPVKKVDKAPPPPGDDLVPSYLQWDRTTLEEPEGWSFVTPRFCENITDFDSSTKSGKKETIIVHYHMQHNAGTNFFNFAKGFAPCATRACLQESKHCMVSYNEEAEAANIRHNYESHGVQYVSYELMLPPRFPLPFVSETARRGLFFTTIVRDPFSRFVTYFRRHGAYQREPVSLFWNDLKEKKGAYAGDNLNARWLSGAQGHLSNDHVNIAKCRLQLFDLVIADKLMDHAIEKVMCPLNRWRGTEYCSGEIKEKEHKSKEDPLKGINTHLIGAWIERIRPSFEIYDYARILSWKQLNERGVTGLPELSEMPSYIATLIKYTNMTVPNATLKKLRVTLENKEHFDPPVKFCDRMKQIWTNNPDEIPDVFGIGSLRKRQ